MRTIKHIFGAVAIAAIILLPSCNKLDLQPDGRILREEIFANRDNVRGYLNSLYIYGPTVSLNHSLYTDEAEPAQLNEGQGASYVEWYGGTAITPLNFSGRSKDGDPWGTYYEGIRKCNIFIAGIQDYNAMSFGNEKSNWEAQARVLRAFYYLQLIKRYGSVPYFDEELNADRDRSNDTKSSFPAIALKIIDDCRKALDTPDDNDAYSFTWPLFSGQSGLVTRAVAYAIMSEAALYAASPLYADGTITWEDAAEITGEALYECLTHDYELFDVVPDGNNIYNAYAYYFLVPWGETLRALDKETIFGYGSHYDVWRNSGLPSTPGQTSAGICPTQNLVDSYEMQATGKAPVTGYSDADKLVPIIDQTSGYDPENPYAGRDPRFYGSVFYNGAPRIPRDAGSQKIETFVGGREGISNSDQRHTRTGYYMRKLHDSNSSQTTPSIDGSLRLFRLAELYLNFAEAALNANQDGYATMQIGSGMSMSPADAINTVRARVEMPPVPAGLDFAAFEKKYRNERRIEFAFEGHRYYDVRRWKILDQTDGKISAMRITKEADNSLTYQRFLVGNRQSNADKFLLYPINQTEVTRVKRATGNDWQNPGW